MLFLLIIFILNLWRLTAYIDWEQQKINEVAKINPTETLPEYFEYVDLDSVKGTSMISHKSFSKNEAPSRAKRLAKKGDIFFQTVRPYQKNNFLFYSRTASKFVFSTGYAQLRPIYNGQYLFSIIQREHFVAQVMRRATGTGYPAINSKDLMNIPIRIPNSLNEQMYLGKTIDIISTLINDQKKQLTLYESLKKYLLQNLFPSDGESIPNVRFADFKENWKSYKNKRILKERNKRIQESLEYPLMSFVKKIGVVPKGKRYDRSFLVKGNKKKYKVTEFGDFIYSSNNLETGSIGMNKQGKAVISPVYSIFYSENSNIDQFISIYFRRNDAINKLLRFRQGVVYGQWKIHEKDFLNMNIKIPSKTNREKIINLFNLLDESINNIELKIIKLNALKKYYLQKLFI
ncbi:hypothetical protein CPR19088_GLDEOEPO_02528 [Companilactobacillus paralimentarius]